MLMAVITFGYIGWMIYIVLHVLQSYTSLPGNFLGKERVVYLRKRIKKVYLFGCLFMGMISFLLLLEHSPPLYHAYCAMTVFLWTSIFSKYDFVKALWLKLQGKNLQFFINLFGTCGVSVVLLELLVKSFTDRMIYTWCFLAMGLTASIYLYYIMPWKSRIPIFIWLASWFLSIFTLMPAEIPDNTPLVVMSGFIIILIGAAAKFLEVYYVESKYFLGLVDHDTKKSKFPMLFPLQALLVGLSSIMVPLSTSRRTEKQELLAIHQLINWSIAGVSTILPFFSSTGLLCRLSSVFLGFAPAFLLLSIGYEAIFYGSLGLALLAWILFENAHLYISNVSPTSTKSMNDENILTHHDRCLQLSDMRIALTFMIFFNVAFFGTGNFASIASFEISSVYRFITIFSPFLMAALLIFKLLIPFMLVICAFSALTKLLRLPLLGCYFLVIICSDVMTIHFFFLVRNTGSWMEIGNSISHFGIMSAQVVFVLLLFALTSIYTKDIQTRSLKQPSRKAM
ncbi:hypothetical protein Leryth_019942 [Lithospermum erythrorhizon]|nr:hypothetical protein Leryth_019942 [Lithospermum erythrorhizon]